MHDVCSDVSPLATTIEKAERLSDVGETVSSPMPDLAEDESESSWMNTTTMVESCSTSTPIDWWKLDSMFMDEDDTCEGQLRSSKSFAAAVSSSSNVSIGERFPPGARKTASSDVCRIEMNKSPRKSFGNAETSVTVHDVCNKTINGDGDDSGGSNGKFSIGEHACLATATTSAPPASSCNSSGTVAAPDSAAAVVTTAQQQQQQQQQRTLKSKCDYSNIRNSSNSGKGKSSRQQTGSAVVGEINLVDGCEYASYSAAAPATAGASPVTTHGFCDEIPSLMTPMFLPELDWTNETCIGGGLDFSNSVVAEGQQLQQHQHWIHSPVSNSSNITDIEFERKIEDYEYTSMPEEGRKQNILEHSEQQQQLAKTTNLEKTVDCSNLLPDMRERREITAGMGRTELSDHSTLIGSSPISLHEEIEQMSTGLDCDTTNHFGSDLAAAVQLPFIASPDDDNHLHLGGNGETISLNILKWLQQDISSSMMPNQQQQQQEQEIAILTKGSSSKDVVDSDFFLAQSTKLSSFPTTSAHIHPPSSLEAKFEKSLDQIQNLNDSPQVAGGGHKTATKRESSTKTLALRDESSHATTEGITTSSAAANATTTTVNPQCDHNYSTIKRRIQDSSVHETKFKIAKVSHEQHVQLPERSVQPYRSSSKASMTNNTNADSCWCSDDTRFTTTSTDASTASTRNDSNLNRKHTLAADLPGPTTSAHTSTDITSITEKKLSVALRKAPTLKVQVGNASRLNTATNASLGLSVDEEQLLLPKMNTPTPMTTNVTHQRLPSQMTLNTPDLTNDILDLEDEKFDLLSFIDTNDDSLDLNNFNIVDEKPLNLGDVVPSSLRNDGEEGEKGNSTAKVLDTQKQNIASSSSSKSAAGSNIYQLLTLDSLRKLTCSKATSSSAATHSSISSTSSASSVCGDSDVSSSTTTTRIPKRRGRPPKAVSTVRDRSQYEHLSEADWRYREQRDKNNEASRKSRINRKDRELKLESEADQLSLQHQKLSYEERRLQRDCQKWRNAVMKLALL